MACLLNRLPPADDEVFVAHVARTGRRLTLRSARIFWKARKTYLRKVLEGAGYEGGDVELELWRFEDAVRAETDRLKQVAWEHQEDA